MNIEPGSIEAWRDALPDYARDLKLNLGSVLTASGAPGLNEKQIWSIALASAIASRNTAFARGIEAQSRGHALVLPVFHQMQEAVVDVVHAHDCRGRAASFAGVARLHLTHMRRRP